MTGGLAVATGGGDAPATDGTHDWADPDDAKIRPGVRLRMPSGSSCTANFVFTGPNGEVYLGTAAHCVEAVGSTQSVDVNRGAAKASVVYDSWKTMDDIGESDPLIKRWNDFALLEIRDGDKDEVSPALIHYGGPTGMADGARFTDHVLTYGNTPLRFGLHASNMREGYVTTYGTWGTNIYTATQGIPGDSGSPVIMDDGKALGVLVTVYFAPVPGQNGVTNLAPALEYARENAGIEAELATWDTLNEGVLPQIGVW